MSINSLSFLVEHLGPPIWVLLSSMQFLDVNDIKIWFLVISIELSYSTSYK